MENLKQTIENKINKLKTVDGFELHRLKINPPVSDFELKKIKSAVDFTINEQLINFYKQFNGVTIEWELNTDDDNLIGSLHIPEMKFSFFGEQDISKKNYQNAMEDILYSDYFDEEQIEKLLSHRAFESVIGDDAYYSLVPQSDDLKLYHIYDGEVNKVKLGFADYVNFRLGNIGLAIDNEIINKKSSLELLQKIPEYKLLQKYLK